MSARAETPPARALARLYCPPEERALFDALLGIEAQVRTGVDGRLEHQIAHARVAWWREECERLARHEPVHPLTRVVEAHLARADAALLAGIAGFSDVAAWDLARATFESDQELRAYCERWSRAFIAPLAQRALVGVAPEGVIELGAHLKELELLNALASDAHQGRIRLPLAELERVGVRPEALQQAHWAAPLAQLVRQRHTGARGALATSIAALTPQSQRALRALLVWALTAGAYSRRTVHALPRATRVGEHHSALDGWRAWRAARRADAGRFVLEP